MSLYFGGCIVNIENNAMPEGYYIPFHKSALEPILAGGIDRNLCFGIWSIGIAIGFMMQMYWFLLVALGSHMFLRELTKEDPDFFQIFKSSIHSNKVFW